MVLFLIYFSGTSACSKYCRISRIYVDIKKPSGRWKRVTVTEMGEEECEVPLHKNKNVTIPFDYFPNDYFSCKYKAGHIYSLI